MSTRFTSLQRLHNAREFSAVLSSRLSKRGDVFSLHQAPSPNGVARLGLVLPKRIAKQAVTRNLIRRQAREAFRHNASVLPALDVVLRLTRSLNELKLGRAAQKKKYRAEIEALLQKIFAAQDVKSSGASL
ncbi:MAG: ribonuclease P protein component [Rhodocyclaceae bacterium]|nr:ribonuclease P protein component [Rhodocyclaceae bacterium]MBL0077061.1 ribonuclease P protein component [Rhodocyclaceae bacterium]